MFCICSVFIFNYYYCYYYWLVFFGARDGTQSLEHAIY